MKNFIKFIVIILLIVVVTCISSYIYFHFVSPKLFVVTSAVEIKKTPFSELYFENNEHILSKPTIIKNYNAVPYTFSFSIHNLEGKNMDYLYIVQMNGAENIIIDNNSVFIKENEKKTITETFLLPNKVDVKTLISVVLLDKKQSISFWMGGQQ